MRLRYKTERVSTLRDESRVSETNRNYINENGKRGCARLVVLERGKSARFIVDHERRSRADTKTTREMFQRKCL